MAPGPRVDWNRMRPRAQVKLAAELISYNHNVPSVITRRGLAILAGKKAIPDPLRRAMGRLAQPGLESNLNPFLKISREKSFVDVGANVGSFTIYFAPRCKQVFAFEPYPPTYRKLLANSRQFPNVIAYNAALGDKEDMLPLMVHDASGHNSLVKREPDFKGEAHLTPVHKLDNLNLRGIGIIKIDTEGYEGSVVRGAVETIARENPRLLIEIHEPMAENEASVTSVVRGYRWRKSFRPGYPQYFLIGEPAPMN
jgi:FkbM family methyltransferase